MKYSRLISVLCLLLLAAFGMSDPKKQINIWVSKDIAPSSKIRIQVNTKNLPVVHVTVYRVDGEAWLRTMGLQKRKRPAILGGPVREWNSTIAQKNQHPNPNQADTYYSRQVNLPPTRPGVYLLSFTGGGQEAWAVVNVTKLAILAKRSPDKMLVWVTDAIGGGVLPDASVKVFTRAGSFVKEYKTGADGTSLFAMKPGDETVVISHGKDLAGVTTGAPDPDGVLVAHFQTDRPIYRPGQTVYFKTILRRTRGQGYAVDAGRTWAVQLRDPKDDVIDEASAIANDVGSISGKFDIPSEGMLGAYTIVVQLGKDSAYQTISVQEYRKPEYKVEVSSAAKRYLAGEEIQFTVDAQYYFGAPVQQAAVHYMIRRAGMPFSSYDPEEGWFYGGDGNLYPSDTYSANPFVAQDTAYTDPNGKVVIKAPSDQNAPDSLYSIDLTVEDSSRRQVQGSGSVPVYAAAVRIAIQAQVQFAHLGEVVPFSIRAVDLDGKPTAATVRIDLVQPRWDEKKGQWFEQHIDSTTVKVPASGKASFRLPAREEGDFVVHAKAADGTGRFAKADGRFWVWGNMVEKKTKEKPQPVISVKLDKSIYRPGQTPKAFIATNTYDAPVLVMVEGGDIWAYKVIRRPKAAQVYEVHTDTQMSPNAFVGVSQWVKGQLLSGNAMIPLPDAAKQLKVEAIPDKKNYEPGDKATYTIRTFSSAGRPVAAEVSLAVVDEAIYALSPDRTPDLYTFYWGQRGNKVESFMSAPEEMSGGAYQRVSTVAPLRQRFEDTAYWAPVVDTGPDGVGTVSFEMPGNLTTWRATARAVTPGTSVGMTYGDVIANRPVMLRLATPRQMVQGDKLTLIGTVDNRSGSEHQFDVSLRCEGVQVSGAATQKITVAAKKQGKVEWVLDSEKLPETGQCVLTGQAVALDVPDSERADMSDALQVKVPIVPKGVRERVVTGGVVSHEAKAELTLPSERIEPATLVTVQVSGGIGATMRLAADRVLNYGRWGTIGAANQLIAAAALKLPSNDKNVRECLALLARNQHPDGWGWWEQAPSDPVITAKVLWALTLARRSGITVYQNLISGAQYAAADRYNRTNLWEHRALLAASLMASHADKARDRIDEVLRRGQDMSPFAKLRMAQAMILGDSPQGASELAEDALKDISDGPTEAFLPTRPGIGWTAGNLETTAEALAATYALGSHKDLQPRLARWIALQEGDSWCSTEEDAAVAWTFSNYVKDHPDPGRVGEVDIEVNGTVVKSTPAKVGDIALATIPRSLLKDGTNSLVLRRSEDGEAFFSVDAAIYLPDLSETVHGVRVLRRFEVQNDAGTWVELHRKVKPGEPVRCTMIAWGDDIPDAMRVVEPLPSGFEFIDGEASEYSRQEVRDGAVIHYLVNQGAPQVFRYYIRAEAEGDLSALPATAEYMRRPTNRGQSNGEVIEVKVLPPAGGAP